MAVAGQQKGVNLDTIADNFVETKFRYQLMKQSFGGPPPSPSKKKPSMAPMFQGMHIIDRESLSDVSFVFVCVCDKHLLSSITLGPPLAPVSYLSK